MKAKAKGNQKWGRVQIEKQKCNIQKNKIKIALILSPTVTSSKLMFGLNARTNRKNKREFKFYIFY